MPRVRVVRVSGVRTSLKASLHDLALLLQVNVDSRGDGAAWDAEVKRYEEGAEARRPATKYCCTLTQSLSAFDSNQANSSAPCFRTTCTRSTATTAWRPWRAATCSSFCKTTRRAASQLEVTFQLCSTEGGALSGSCP